MEAIHLAYPGMMPSCVDSRRTIANVCGRRRAGSGADGQAFLPQLDEAIAFKRTLDLRHRIAHHGFEGHGCRRFRWR